MLNALIRKYNYATVDTILGLQLPFIHARGTCIITLSGMIDLIHNNLLVGKSVHLWGFELCDEKLYVLKKLYVAEVPTSWNNTSEIISLGVLTWNLAVRLIMDFSVTNVLMTIFLAKLANACEIVAEEHRAYGTGKWLGVVEEDRDLSFFIDTSIKRAVKGSKYGVLLPHDKSCNV